MYATGHKEKNSFQLRSNSDPLGCRKTLTLHGKKLSHTLSRIFKITDWMAERKASQGKKNSIKEIKENHGEDDKYCKQNQTEYLFLASY